MSIYITGDLHAKAWRFCEACMPGESSWTKDDKLIICGDFGLIWHNKSDHTGKKADDTLLDMLAAKPYTILFVDGNHENFNELYAYPETEKYGAPVHKIRSNIYHLERGRIYVIDGKSFFAFGGAYSIDRCCRQQDISWWQQELPNDEEYNRGVDALKSAGRKVDYVLTHTGPKEIVQLMLQKLPSLEEYELGGYLDWILHEIDFKEWFFGHWHTDKSQSFTVQDKNKVFHALCFDIKKI